MFLIKTFYKIYFHYILLFAFLFLEINAQIRFEDGTLDSGIDFTHFAPRPRWCEIGPTVVGSATNEELSLVFDQEKEFWNSNGRLLTLDEFANVHLIKMNGSGGAWIDYDEDGDWDLYLVNCQGEENITNILFKNNKEMRKVTELLDLNKIGWRPLFYPAHKMPMYKNYEYIKSKNLTISLCKRGIILPSYPCLREIDFKKIINVIRSYFKD